MKSFVLLSGLVLSGSVLAAPIIDKDNPDRIAGSYIVKLKSDVDRHGFTASEFVLQEADRMAQIFQPFELGDASMTRRYGGTGLGLAICRQLVEQMDGVFEVDSTPGRGTTFTVRLPLGAPA